MEDDFTAQAQRFVRSEVFCAVTSGLAVGEWYHFSWQAQCFVRVLRCGRTIFVAGAGNREVARCGGGHNSWQVQYFVRVRRVDAQIFVAGAGNREVARCGGGECRCDIRIGV